MMCCIVVMMTQMMMMMGLNNAHASVHDSLVISHTAAPSVVYLLTRVSW